MQWLGMLVKHRRVTGLGIFRTTWLILVGGDFGASPSETGHGGGEER